MPHHMTHEQKLEHQPYSKKLPEPKTVYVVDFFCGCGGMSYGFTQTRQSHQAFEVLGGIDIDPVALETYQRNIPAMGILADVFPIAKDPLLLLELLKRDDLPTLRPLLFIGCAPCQGFSSLRKGDERDDPRNSLMMAFAKIVAHFRPDVVVMENVPEILSGRFSKYYNAAARKIQKAGYSLTSGILDTSRYGVPQKRKRALVFGSLHGRIALPNPPIPANQVLTVRHAIAHLRPLSAGEVDPYDELHRAPSHTARLVEMFKLIPPDGGGRRDLPLHLKLDAHKRLDSGETPGFTDVYGRLRWDTPSVTITAKSRSPGSGRFLHPEQHRNISVREAAILQGFPQSFSFAGTPTRQYRNIGEAVPPMLARFIASSILDHFSPQTGPTANLIFQPDKPRLSKMSPRPLQIVDAFCGAGGISLGFSAAGVPPLFAFDIDHDSICTYQKNISQSAEVWDVANPDLLTKLNRTVKGANYCLVGGPPCQGFSHQRRGNSDDPRNELVLRFVDLIESLQTPPAAIILENVTDLELPRGRTIKDKYVARLHALGYTTIRHELNSADFGIPQLRRRILLVALPHTVAELYQNPTPLTPKRWVTVGEALQGLPSYTQGAEIPAISNHEPSKEGPENRRRIAYVDMGFGRKSIPPDLQLPCHAASYRGHRDVFGRLDWFSQARTITGGFDSFTRGEFAHPFFHRSITPREAARIQGFPDEFAFVGNRASVRRQIGNAVPPPLAFALAKAIDRALRKKNI